MSDKSKYLNYLPAHFQENPFLGRFLLPFEAHLDELSSILDHIARYFDPYLTDADFLPWLGTWVALVLDPEWEEGKRRELIARAVELYKRRGTVAGLKEYLKIYTGLEPEIREWCWPGGMQIGVASMIGGLTCSNAPTGFPSDPVISDLSPIVQVRRYPPEYTDYYVLEMLEEEVVTSTVYYATDDPRAVHVTYGLLNATPYVDITDEDGHVTRYSPARVTRRDHVICDVYPLTSASGITAEYSGDTFLIDELSGADFLPYHFIVDVKIPPDQNDKVKMDKVKAIVDLEKPAHTVYYLKLTDVEGRVTFSPMQIDVRSDIGINTVVG
jgi:phage tail-like protein